MKPFFRFCSRHSVLLLAWLTGTWLLWMVTPIHVNGASAVSSLEEPIGFLDQGKLFVTVDQSDFIGPILIRNIETGKVERTLFTSKDRFMSIYVDRDHDNLLRVERSLGKTQEGKFEYVLEWIDGESGRTEVSVRSLYDIELKSRQSPFPAALSRNRRYVSYSTLVENQQSIVCDDLQTGKRLYSWKLPVPRSAVRFSPDSQRLFCRQDNEYLVIDVSSGKRVLNITNANPGAGFFIGYWSPNSQLLVTTDGAVWNLNTLAKQSQLKSIDYGPQFNQSCTELTTTMGDQAGIWVVKYDLATGEEIKNKRVLVFPGMDWNPTVRAAPNRDGSLFLVNAQNPAWKSGVWQQKLEQCISFVRKQLAGWSYMGTSRYAIVDVAKNSIIMNVNGHTFQNCFSPDGRFLFVLNSSDNSAHWIWDCLDVPPRKVLAVFFQATAAWLIGLIIIRWFFHQVKSRKSMETQKAGAVLSTP